MVLEFTSLGKPFKGLFFRTKKTTETKPKGEHLYKLNFPKKKKSL